MQEYLTHSEAETEQAGADFARALPDGKVVAMYGELGSGKTAFVRGMARGMGLTCRVSSPTFTIVNEYEGPRELIHFDMYRLGSADELFDIGWEDYVNRGSVCAVEWSENVEDAFYGDEVVVRFEKLGPTTRRITITAGHHADPRTGVLGQGGVGRPVPRWSAHCPEPAVQRPDAQLHAAADGGADAEKYRYQACGR